MRIVFKYTIFTIFSVLFLMSAFASAQTNPGSARGKNPEQTTKKPEEKSTQTEKTNKTEETIELTFPEIENWERGDVRTYSSAELGYSVSYTSQEGGTVSLFVYNGGNDNIGDGVKDKTVIDEFNRTKSRMKTIGGEFAVEVKSDTVTLGGTGGKVSALRALYNFKLQGQDVDSEIFIFGHKGNFIKIMATRPKSKNGVNNALANFLAEIDRMFAK